MSQGQRRLAAIMFTDMVGYTALGQRNESLSLALVEEQRKLIRPILAKHSGREVKTMGDAFMVEFLNAVDAVRCAYDIQRGIREFNLSLAPDKRIHLRIGLHVGEVVESQGDISGDAVNVASRIEPLADDGGVCVTRHVYDLVRTKVDLNLSSIGQKSLKNVNETMEVYKMVMPWEKELASPSGQLDTRRIAVLPFVNMSPDPNDEYFADGMTEEMISMISRISGLRVIARTSVMGYKEGQKKIGDIAKELEVGTILEGSVRKAGDQLRITVQLIDSRSNDHLWAENYDRELRDVFAIQSEVAQRVARSLEVRLLSPGMKDVERIPTENLEAYTLYLQGRYHFRKFTEDGLKKSEELYQKALTEDSKFAAAYEGLASTYAFYGFLAILPEKEAYPKAREFAERALELNESLAESHYILGRVLLEYYWAFSAGESEFRRSIELNPNNATVRLAYSWLLASRLENERASIEAEKAVQLDPKSSEAWWSGSYTFYLLSNFEKGIEYGRRAVEVNALDPFSHHLLTFSYLFSGRPEEAIKEMREAVALANNHVMHRANLAFVYGFAGKTAEARKILNEMIETAKTEYIAPILFVWAYASLDPDNFFAWLEKAYEARSSFLVYTINDPFTIKTGLRKDPRFKAIMNKVGVDTSRL